MTLNELINQLNSLQEKHGDKEISLLIETPKNDDNPIQLEYPLNGISIFENQNKIILMHEEW